MASKDPDLLIIGGGAAGLAAAFVAKWRGRRALIVQDGPIGGDCTFTGCVPSKALLAAAHDGAEFPEAMRRVRRAVSTIAATESADRLREDGIDVVEGRARCVGGTAVEVAGRRLQAPRLLLAAGSAPAVPPIPGLASVAHMTSHDLWDLDELPPRLGIIGGGPIGCEMADAFASMGSTVTVFEGFERLLPRDEPEAAAVVAASLERRGVDVRTGVKVSSVEHDAGGHVVVRASSGTAVTVDRLLVATGRRPSLDDLDPQAAGVRLTEDGWVDVDEHLATAASGVYAVGDVVGQLQLTHAAARMSHLAVENAFRVGASRLRPGKWVPAHIPWVTYTSPEVGHVGLTEQEAAPVRGARVAEFEMAHLDRAIAVDRTEGFIKLIAAPRRGLRNLGGGRLIGATVVGERAGEMLGELSLAVRTNMFVGRLAQTVHAYPTWNFGIAQAATQFFTDAISGQAARPVRG